jgi:hypothetical protein
MSDDPVVREGVTARYAVTHEVTPEGTLIISEDQVITVEEGQELDVPLGEEVPADPLEQQDQVPTVVDVPHVSGNGVVGDTLACTMGNWDSMQTEPHSYAYAWQTDGVDNGATGETYSVLAGDVGKSISCVVTASNAAGSTAAPPSNAILIADAARSGGRSYSPPLRQEQPAPAAPGPTPRPASEQEV